MSAAYKDRLAWLLVGLFAGIVIGLVALSLRNGTRPGTIYITPARPVTITPGSTATSFIRVYVTGQVREPAVYQIPVGGIVQDLVLAAGGFTAEADQEIVNLAMPLSDGMHVHVPSVDELSTSSGEERQQFIVTTPGIGLVNINLASLEELDRLPGIGPSTAQKIIDYRLIHGDFLSPEDIMNVSGIGAGKFEQMKGLITIE